MLQSEDLDEKSLDFLVQALESNNLPGFDYLEFKRAVLQLQEINLDEPTAYKSAVTTAATLGITKEKLLETAGYYRNLIEKEMGQFNEALENQSKTKIASRQHEISRLRDQIDRHKAEIERLNNEMGDYLNQVNQAENTSKQEAEKLEKAKVNFEKTNKAVLLQIDKDVENMHKYL